MAKTKEQKGEIVSKLEGAMKGAASTVFVHFSKVTVAEESAMRRQLRGEGVGYIVAKKTLIRRALEQLGLKGELALEGEIALAYGMPEKEDATAPARLIHEIGQKLVDKLAIVGGIFGGALVGQEKMQEIATIPPMQTLRGMFANVIASPISGFAIALKAIADKKAQ